FAGHREVITCKGAFDRLIEGIDRIEADELAVALERDGAAARAAARRRTRRDLRDAEHGRIDGAGHIIAARNGSRMAGIDDRPDEGAVCLDGRELPAKLVINEPVLDAVLDRIVRADIRWQKDLVLA